MSPNLSSNSHTPCAISEVILEDDTFLRAHDLARAVRRLDLISVKGIIGGLKLELQGADPVQEEGDDPIQKEKEKADYADGGVYNTTDATDSITDTIKSIASSGGGDHVSSNDRFSAEGDKTTFSCKKNPFKNPSTPDSRNTKKNGKEQIQEQKSQEQKSQMQRKFNLILESGWQALGDAVLVSRRKVILVKHGISLEILEKQRRALFGESSCDVCNTSAGIASSSTSAGIAATEASRCQEILSLLLDMVYFLQTETGDGDGHSRSQLFDYRNRRASHTHTNWADSAPILKFLFSNIAFRPRDILLLEDGLSQDAKKQLYFAYTSTNVRSNVVFDLTNERHCNAVGRFSAFLNSGSVVRMSGGTDFSGIMGGLGGMGGLGFDGMGGSSFNGKGCDGAPPTSSLPLLQIFMVLGCHELAKQFLGMVKERDPTRMSLGMVFPELQKVVDSKVGSTVIDGGSKVGTTGIGGMDGSKSLLELSIQKKDNSSQSQNNKKSNTSKSNDHKSKSGQLLAEIGIHARHLCDMQTSTGQTALEAAIRGQSLYDGPHRSGPQSTSGGQTGSLTEDRCYECCRFLIEDFKIDVNRKYTGGVLGRGREMGYISGRNNANLRPGQFTTKGKYLGGNILFEEDILKGNFSENLHLLDLLIKKGNDKGQADVNFTDNEGETVLSRMLRTGKVTKKMVEIMVERYGATLPGIGGVGGVEGENYQSGNLNCGSSSSSSPPLPRNRTLSFFTLRKVIDEIGEGRWWDGGNSMTATGFGPAARLCWIADKLKVDLTGMDGVPSAPTGDGAPLGALNLLRYFRTDPIALTQLLLRGAKGTIEDIVPVVPPGGANANNTNANAGKKPPSGILYNLSMDNQSVHTMMLKRNLERHVKEAVNAMKDSNNRKEIILKSNIVPTIPVQKKTGSTPIPSIPIIPISYLEHQLELLPEEALLKIKNDMKHTRTLGFASQTLSTWGIHGGSIVEAASGRIFDKSGGSSGVSTSTPLRDFVLTYVKQGLRRFYDDLGGDGDGGNGNTTTMEMDRSLWVGSVRSGRDAISLVYWRLRILEDELMKKYGKDESQGVKDGGKNDGTNNGGKIEKKIEDRTDKVEETKTNDKVDNEKVTANPNEKVTVDDDILDIEQLLAIPDIDVPPSAEEIVEQPVIVKEPEYEDVLISLFQGLWKTEHEYGVGKRSCGGGSINFILSVLQGRVDLDESKWDDDGIKRREREAREKREKKEKEEREKREAREKRGEREKREKLEEENRKRIERNRNNPLTQLKDYKTRLEDMLSKSELHAVQQEAKIYLAMMAKADREVKVNSRNSTSRNEGNASNTHTNTQPAQEQKEPLLVDLYDSFLMGEDLQYAENALRGRFFHVLCEAFCGHHKRIKEKLGLVQKEEKKVPWDQMGKMVQPPAGGGGGVGGVLKKGGVGGMNNPIRRPNRNLNNANTNNVNTNNANNTPLPLDFDFQTLLRDLSSIAELFTEITTKPAENIATLIGPLVDEMEVEEDNKNVSNNGGNGGKNKNVTMVNGSGIGSNDDVRISSQKGISSSQNGISLSQKPSSSSQKPGIPSITFTSSIKMKTPKAGPTTSRTPTTSRSPTTSSSRLPKITCQLPPIPSAVPSASPKEENNSKEVDDDDDWPFKTVPRPGPTTTDSSTRNFSMDDTVSALRAAGFVWNRPTLNDSPRNRKMDRDIPAPHPKAPAPVSETVSNSTFPSTPTSWTPTSTSLLSTHLPPLTTTRDNFVTNHTSFRRPSVEEDYGMYQAAFDTHCGFDNVYQMNMLRMIDVMV